MAFLAVFWPYDLLKTWWWKLEKNFKCHKNNFMVLYKWFVAILVIFDLWKYFFAILREFFKKRYRKNRKKMQKMGNLGPYKTVKNIFWPKTPNFLYFLALIDAIPEIGPAENIFWK